MGSTVEPADSRWEEPQWELDSKNWESSPYSSQPAVFGTLDVISVLGNTERPSRSRTARWARNGSSSTTTPEHSRQHCLWNLQRAFRVARWASSSLRMVRACPTLVEPTFRQWTSWWRDMSQMHTNQSHLQGESASTTTRSSSRSLEHSFPDEFQKVHNECAIGCVSFIVIMEFFFCIAKEDCTTRI